MDMMEQVIDPAKIYMKVVKIILSSSTENIFRMRFVLFEDLPSPTERNFKKLLLQQVGSKFSTDRSEFVRDFGPKSFCTWIHGHMIFF